MSRTGDVIRNETGPAVKATARGAQSWINGSTAGGGAVAGAVGKVAGAVGSAADWSASKVASGALKAPQRFNKTAGLLALATATAVTIGVVKGLFIRNARKQQQAQELEAVQGGFAPQQQAMQQLTPEEAQQLEAALQNRQPVGRFTQQAMAEQQARGGSPRGLA